MCQSPCGPAALTRGSASSAQAATMESISHLLPAAVIAALIVAAACLLAAAYFSAGRVRWLAVAAGLAAVFATLVAGLNVHRLAAIDVRVDTWLGVTRSHLRAQRLFGILGDPGYVLAALVLSGTLLALRARSALPAILLAAGFTAGVALEETFKALIAPHSFPSGHVTGSAVLFGMTAVCLGIGRSAAEKTALTILAVQGVVFVAALAVYTRAHTVSDTVGGMVLGGAIVAVGAALLDGSRAGRRSSRRHRSPART